MNRTLLEELRNQNNVIISIETNNYTSKVLLGILKKLKYFGKNNMLKEIYIDPHGEDEYATEYNGSKHKIYSIKLDDHEV